MRPAAHAVWSGNAYYPVTQGSYVPKDGLRREAMTQHQVTCRPRRGHAGLLPKPATGNSGQLRFNVQRSGRVLQRTTMNDLPFPALQCTKMVPSGLPRCSPLPSSSYRHCENSDGITSLFPVPRVGSDNTESLGAEQFDSELSPAPEAGFRGPNCCVSDAFNINATP